MKTYLKRGLYVLVLALSYCQSFSQSDTLCGKKTSATINLVYGTSYNAYSNGYAADLTAAQPIVTTQNMINSKYKLGIGVWSAWQLPPSPPTLFVSQGDFKDRIKLTWEINPLSPRPTGFVLYRDGSFLANLDEDTKEYLDFFAQAGEFYQYSIAAKNAYGQGSTNKAVGFLYPNGVVTGKITTTSGNAVPGVEVRLTPSTGNSMAFDGISGQLCVSYNSLYPNKFPTTAFTISTYVKLPTGTNTNDEAGIIDWGSNLKKNWWITTTKSTEGKGFIFHIGNGTGSDTLKYIIPVNNSTLLGNDEKWHQITMMYNGTTMSVLVDGDFIGTKPATIVRESKQRMTIGSKINSAYFKGLVDDIRIYNRTLTQTEVNETKNRSISKTENGLVAYFKMDEGLGNKTFDTSILPTSAFIYGGATFSTDKPEVYNAGISDETGYYIIDGVNYSTTENFRASPMKNFEFNTALEFNAADKAYGNLTNFSIPDTATIEVLFHPFDIKSRQTILSKENLFELYLNNEELFLKVNNGVATNLGIIKAKYYLVSVVMNKTKGTGKVYIDDTFKTNISFTGNTFWDNGKPWLVATNDTTINGKFYTGLIDEVAIFKKYLSLPEIQLHSTVGIPNDSTRANLFSYFDFNEGTDTKVYDYFAVNANIGQPRIGNITRASWSNNARRRLSNPHEFEPNVRVVNLNKSNTAIGNIDFRDVSTVNMSGTVRFANTFCFEDKVEILVNGKSNVPQITTDAKGKWSADFEPGSNITLKPVYKDHTFTPESIQFRKLQVPRAGIVFLDNTKRTISGQVAGGLCKKSIVPAGGKMVVKVATLDGCFERTDTIIRADGKYIFKDLPARAFSVSVVEHSNSVIKTYFQNKGGQEVDLRDSASAKVDFIYIASPQVEITGITPNTCGYRIAGQLVENKITAKVYEQYEGGVSGKCYLKGFNLKIDDPSTGNLIDTTLMSRDSVFAYVFKPKFLNIVSPYLQTVTISTLINGSRAVGTTNFAVIGLKSTGKSFVANTPEIPKFVLRDPPGDASYAVLQKGSNACTTYNTTIINNLSGEAYAAPSIGGDQIVGLGVAIIFKNKATITASGGGDQTWSTTETNTTCLTTTQTITTSPNDIVVGSKAGGDVYVGTSNAITFGEAILLNFNKDSCKFTNKATITIDKTELNTDFYYSENFIITNLIPKLDSIASNTTVTQLQRDKARIGKGLWKSYIKKNREDINKNEASSNVVVKSFDAGAIFEESIQADTTRGDNSSYEVASWYQLALDVSFSTGVIGWEAGASIRNDDRTLNDTLVTKTRSTVITYHLEDNDAGDNFLMKIHKKGKIWGTPIFEMIAGETSCPYELGTKPRSEPSLTTVDGTSKTNISANAKAVYTVNLGNFSPTKEPKVYDFSLVKESNPDGAIVKVNGIALTGLLPFSVEYGTNLPVVVTIERGPTKYNYTGIQIQLESSCETDNAGQRPTGGGVYADSLYGKNVADSLFARRLSLSASFIEPCSPVDISSPLQDFVVTPATNNRVSITLNEYVKSDPNLELIRLQYRPTGGDGSWINISETLPADLGNVFTLKEWNTTLLKDGPYEIRAITQCKSVSLAPGISTIIKGTLERHPPEVVGVPQPADGIWDPGDEISITFNKTINCDRLVIADVLGNNTIGLYDATTNALVAATFSCVANKITIVPTINPKDFENRTFRVEISGKDYDDAKIVLNPAYQRGALRDKAGNMIPKTIKWEFAVNQNNLEWVGTDVIETNEVLKPFSVKRQIRNRGGSIASFRMESIPSWLTVTPSTGTLNPGQVADVTLIFQQDLLIGDYLDTLNMVGSRGSEPLLIDYRVRCPQPKYEVLNQEQYEGTMNMVVDLSIFGISSTDPSDVIVAKIGGQIRGVGRVAYFRNIPADKQRWLTFLTIYGNSGDEDKPVEFTIWDGNKCNEYVEILENYTYRDGSLVGSPLVPTPVSVLNLVKKCIPLNRGFNWVSFNLNLGTGRNTVSNMLSSLKNKTGAYIKTDNSFAEYLPNYGWDALDTLIYPTKRYMVFVLARDTVCIKGTPYEARSYPIAIKNSWNWIGYVPSTGMTVTQALKGLTPLNGDIIKSQTLFAQFVAGVGWIGNLSFLEPLKGYLLKISNAGTLTYPTTNSLSSGLIGTTDLLEKEAARGLQLQSLQESAMTFDFTQYEQTMNLIGKVNGMEIDDEDELRAYIDGVLVGTNKAIVDKKERLFFQTIYYQDEQNIKFKLFKADRNKEFSLDKSVVFKSETLVGLVENPVVFNVITTLFPPVTIKVEDIVIKHPVAVFPTISIPANIVESNANCSSYSVSTILPLGTETKPTCSAPTMEANMSTVIKIRFNERTGFVSDNDVLTFINPSTNAVLGCATFNSSNKLFYGTIAGPTGSATFPVDVKYFSNTMKKSFTLKSAVTYKVNDRLGNAVTSYELNIAPLSVTILNGVVTAAMRDTSWTGSYGVNVFALDCSGYSDGQATFNFYRLKSGDCIEVIDRKITDVENKDIQAVKITSQATINAGFNINYQGGNVIELKPGFDAKSGAIFTGKIEGCNNK